MLVDTFADYKKKAFTEFSIHQVGIGFAPVNRFLLVIGCKNLFYDLARVCNRQR